MLNLERSHQKANFESALESGFGIENYPTDPNITGHLPNILLPGLCHFTQISPFTEILTSSNSPEALKLSQIYKTEIVLAKIVPEAYVDLAIVRMAQALNTAITDPDKTVFSALLTGGDWVYRRLNKLIPHLMNGNRRDFGAKRTYGASLGSIAITQNFNSTIEGKSVWIIEDLGDEHLTLQRAVEQAKFYGANDVNIAMLTNKLSVPGKIILPEIKIVGLGIPNIWVGGAGADVQDNLCREFEGVWVKMTADEWWAHQAANLPSWAT